MSDEQEPKKKGKLLSRKKGKSLIYRKPSEDETEGGTIKRSKKKRAKSLRAKPSEETLPLKPELQKEQEPEAVQNGGEAVEDNASKSKLSFKDKFKNRLSQRKNSKGKEKTEEKDSASEVRSKSEQEEEVAEKIPQGKNVDNQEATSFLSNDKEETNGSGKKVKFSAPLENEAIVDQDKEKHVLETVPRNGSIPEQEIRKENELLNVDHKPDKKQGLEEGVKNVKEEPQSERTDDLRTPIDYRNSIEIEEKKQEDKTATDAYETHSTTALTDSDKSGVDTESTVDLDGITTDTEHDVFNEAISELMTESSLKSSMELQTQMLDEKEKSSSTRSYAEVLSSSASQEPSDMHDNDDREITKTADESDRFYDAVESSPESLEEESPVIKTSNPPILQLQEDEQKEDSTVSLNPGGRNTCETLEEKPSDWEYVEHPNENSTEQSKTLRKMAMGKLYQNMRMSKTYCACCSVM